MDFDLEGALRQYPLPEGVPDATLKLYEMAEALQITEPTIKRYIGKGMPVVSSGSNGKGYELRLSECYAWKLWRDAQDARETAMRGQAVNQMRLAFRNADEDEEGPTLTAAEIKAESEAEITRLKAAQLRGELIPTERVRETIERAIVGFRNGMITFPDFAEMELGLAPAEVDKLQRWVDGVLEDLELRLGEAVAPAGEVHRLSRAGQTG